MHRESSEVIAADLNFAGVEPDAQLDPERFGGDNDGLGAANGASWAVEGDEKAVASYLDLPATMSAQLPADRSVARVEQRPPPLVARRGTRCRRPDDAGRAHRL